MCLGGGALYPSIKHKHLSCHWLKSASVKGCLCLNAGQWVWSLKSVSWTGCVYIRSDVIKAKFRAQLVWLVSIHCAPQYQTVVATETQPTIFIFLTSIHNYSKCLLKRWSSEALFWNYIDCITSIEVFDIKFSTIDNFDGRSNEMKNVSVKIEMKETEKFRHQDLPKRSIWNTFLIGNATASCSVGCFISH